MHTPKLGRKRDNRGRTIRNLATSAFLYERIRTTDAKAEAVRPLVERLITYARTGSLAARRAIKAELFDPMAVTKLMDDAANRVGTRTSGFVRITKLPARPGDGAKMVELEILYTPLEAAAPAGDADVKVRRAKKTEV